MVLKNDLDNNGRKTGFHVPVIPRARRSSRRRARHENTILEGQVCAIEMLATLAGKLLQENNNGVVGKGVIKHESKAVNKPLKAEPFDPVSNEEMAFLPKSCLGKDEIRGRDDVKAVMCKGDIFGRSCGIDYEREVKDVEQKEKPGKLGSSHSSATSSPMFLDSKPGFDAKLGRRDDDDDDENLHDYDRRSHRFKTFRHPQNVRDCRTMKEPSSNNEPEKTHGRMHPVFRKRKVLVNHERSRWQLLYKKRKLFDPESTVTSDGSYSSQSISNLRQKGINDKKEASSSILSRQSSFCAKDSRVKFTIESFKIPELLIEVPRTATVGSLKRTVMEAVTAILGDGLRIGVILEGKKIRDDTRTLLQSGISCKDKIDTLDFTLEPSPIPQITGREENLPLLSPCDGPPPLNRSREDSALDISTASNPLPDPLQPMNYRDKAESNSLLTSASLKEKPVPETRAIVPGPFISPRPLSAVPMIRKGPRADVTHRRIRRPFSVSEVEALVQAVEELGTGRWRDVKMRAFESAVHRTYVDLKNKWKTLVHTASIAPQQRRGEPVPQELLDRVLSAHAYWSQSQSRQRCKNIASQSR